MIRAAIVLGAVWVAALPLRAQDAPVPDSAAGGILQDILNGGQAGAAGLAPGDPVRRPAPPATITEAVAAQTATAPGARLRGLDKVSGAITDLDLRNGGQTDFGRLTVELSECRYPADSPTADAYAHLTIAEAGTTLFQGWMIASSPALNALDDARYDIWVLGCAPA